MAMDRPLLSLCLAAALLLPLSGTAAEPADRDLPLRGTAMDAVEARYGPPQAIHGPVGDPPITRWTYGDFEVFFEGDTVIHAAGRKQLEASSPDR